MATGCVVQARVDRKIKDKAARVLEKMGLSVSDLMRMTLLRVADDGEIPLGVLSLNKETREALQESSSRKGLKKASSIKELMNELNADD